MTEWLKYTLTLTAAMLLMVAVRTLVVSVHSVDGTALEPLFHDGDRLLVNRCSYGLRIEGNRLLPYSRLWRQPVRRGDIVAFKAPGEESRGILIARCTAVPGDSVSVVGGPLVVPGTVNCADGDYFWLESLNSTNPADSRHLGFIHERYIVGRVATVLYNSHNSWMP